MSLLKTIRHSGWALALAASLLAPGSAWAQNLSSLHDGAVVDGVSGIAYVMSQQGGIDALDLTSGNVLWKNRDAAKPLALAEGILVAQARPDRNGILSLVMIDAQKGASQGRTEVQIPEKLRANVIDGPAQTFHVKAFATSSESVTVTWLAENVVAQGYLPTLPEIPQTTEAATAKQITTAQEAVESARKPLRGAARLDIKAARAVAVPYEEAEQTRPALAIEAKAAGASGARQLTSLDGRHVLRSEPFSEGGLRTPYRWTVTTASGAQVGTLNAPVSMAPFVVSDSKILYVAQPTVRREESKFVQQPLRLVASDLRTGAELWTKAFIDPVYRGPFPP